MCRAAQTERFYSSNIAVGQVLNGRVSLGTRKLRLTGELAESGKEPATGIKEINEIHPFRVQEDSILVYCGGGGASGALRASAKLDFRLALHFRIA